MPPRDSVRVRTEARLTAGSDSRQRSEPRPPARPERGGPARRRRILGRATGFGRTIWRQLTSMRTALILLFLLAIASLPGALLPQWHLNTSKTAQYILDHPTIGPVLNRLGFFDAFASPWYSAIYLLLGISLIGCILPRSAELARQWLAKPSAAPRNLGRLPHHATLSAPGTPDAIAESIRLALRRKGIGGWRAAVRGEGGGAVTVSAERGYLREVGNVAFHVSVLGLLIAMAVGSTFGYTGSIIVGAGEGFCSSAPIQYDNFRPGRMVDGTDMAPFCVTVTAFHADYTESGMARSFRADVKVQSGAALHSNVWTDRVLQVNDPLRISGQRLYLLGHGYMPTFTVRYPDGETRDYTAPFEPKDALFTSEGVVKITDPPGYTGADARKNQLAIVGIFAPSAVLAGGVLTSANPELLAPAVAVEVYRGDLGVDDGKAQSVFAIDNDQVTKGLLKSQGRQNLTVGESMTLSDGTTITFTGAKDFVSLQTSYDPAQGWALVFAIGLVAGLLASLTIKRRRVWFRITPAPARGVAADGSPPEPGKAGRTLSSSSAGGAAPLGGPPDPEGAGDPVSVVDVGGLARTDQAGYGAEFDSLVALVNRSGMAGPSAVPTVRLPGTDVMKDERNG